MHFAGGVNSSMIAEIIPGPRLSLTQPGGPGTGVAVGNTYLSPGAEYFNVFSLEPAPGGVGTGPYLGLYASDPSALLMQIMLPVGAAPFHFVAASPTASFGPYPGFTGSTIEGVSFSFSSGHLGCAGIPRQLNVH
jgi:hypothetical protein